MTYLSLFSFPVSEMTYTVSSGTLNSTIPYHTSLLNILTLFILFLCLLMLILFAAGFDLQIRTRMVSGRERASGRSSEYRSDGQWWSSGGSWSRQNCQHSAGLHSKTSFIHTSVHTGVLRCHSSDVKIIHRGHRSTCIVSVSTTSTHTCTHRSPRVTLV